MTPGKVLITSLLILMLAAPRARGAESGLIILEDFTHSLGLLYQHSGQDLSGNGHHTSSSQDRFEQNYDLSLNYAIYSPRILKGRISLLGTAEQDFATSSLALQSTSNSTKTLGFQYNVYGIFLERGYTPAKLYASSSLSHVQSNFSPGYDLNSDSMGVATGIRNRILPVSFDLVRSTSETSGLPNDRIQTNDQITIRSFHTIPLISQTDMELTRTDSKSAPKLSATDTLGTQTHRSFEGSLKNALTLQAGKYTLNSAVRLRDEVGLIQTRNFDWNESFAWQVGNALSLGLGTSHNSTSQSATPVSAATVTSDSRVSNSGTFWLSHRLFKNLVSRLELSGRKSDLEGGTEQEYTGNLNLNYSRSLPNDGNLTLVYNELRDLTDRAFSSNLGHAIDEPLTVQPPGQNPLQQFNVIIDSIVVRDADPLVRVIPYVRGIDYDVVQVGATTQLSFTLPGSAITVGKRLLISYDFLVNQSIKYETASHKLGGSVFLAGGHKFYANVDKTDQTLLAGQANQVRLNNSVGYQVGFISEYRNYTYGAENTYVDSTLDRHSFYEGFVKYYQLFSASQLVCQARDRYAMYGITDANPKEYNENLFSLTGSYTTPVFRDSSAVLMGAFTDSRGGAFARQEAELGLTFQWGYGKIFVKVNGKINWINLGGNTTLNDNLVLEVKRYF